MQQVVIPLKLERRGFGQTMRRDAWWAQPLLTFTVLGAFVAYSTWAAFQSAALRVRALSVALLLTAAVR